MKFKKLFDRKNKDYVTIKVNTSNVPDGLLRKCKKCSSIVLAEDVKNNNYICPKCGGYFRFMLTEELRWLWIRIVLSLCLKDLIQEIH